MSENHFEHDKEFIVKTFIPDIYMDSIDKGDKNPKDIPDSDSKITGVYRFYGIYVGFEHKVGYIKYHILFNSSTIEIDRIEVSNSYRDEGYGTMLMSQSLADLVNDFPHIESVSVCSTASAIRFYIKNDFKPFCGDNNLVRTLQKSDIKGC